MQESGAARHVVPIAVSPYGDEAYMILLAHGTLRATRWCRFSAAISRLRSFLAACGPPRQALAGNWSWRPAMVASIKNRLLLTSVALSSRRNTKLRGRLFGCLSPARTGRSIYRCAIYCGRGDRGSHGRFRMGLRKARPAMRLDARQANVLGGQRAGAVGRARGGLPAVPLDRPSLPVTLIVLRQSYYYYPLALRSARAAGRCEPCASTIIARLPQQAPSTKKELQWTSLFGFPQCTFWEPRPLL